MRMHYDIEKLDLSDDTEKEKYWYRWELINEEGEKVAYGHHHGTLEQCEKEFDNTMREIRQSMDNHGRVWSKEEAEKFEDNP